MRNYTYGIGASWELSFPMRPIRTGQKIIRQERPVRYTVEACRLSGRTEYYSVAMQEADGSITREELSCSRLHYLLNFHLRQKYSDGRRAPLPLTAAEVSEYYEARRAEKYADYKRARYMLEHNKEYCALDQKKRELIAQAGKAEAFGERERAAKLAEELHRTEVGQRAIRENLGIPETLLRLEYDCPVCRDRGVLSDGKTVCACAQTPERERAIRKYIGVLTGEVQA